MPKCIISELSPEQEAMLPSYRDKWRSLSISTEPIDREKVAAVIKAAYAVSGYYEEPEILFYNSPMEAIKKVIEVENFKAYLGRDIHIKFIKRVIDHLQHQIGRQFEDKLFTRLRNQIHIPEFPYYSTESQPRVSYFPYGIESRLQEQLINDLNQTNIEYTDFQYFTNNLTRPAEGAIWGCVFDFCISVLKLQHDRQKWQVWQELMQQCGFIFQFEKVCIACDRPCKLSFDRKNLLHAEGEPAMQFADGYSIYACHGQYPYG